MRKKLIVCIIAALCLFVSASPWEGAAVAAPEGELPGNGRYIATNSFPKNTIVDIVNIETNKSTRVIVAGSLDSPGLLAIVSKEAAELIGMRPGSVSRIRMTQPSDPVAYARFSEGLSSGITDYDSGDVITEDKYNEEFVNPARPSRAAREYDDPFGDFPSTPSFAGASGSGYPAYVLEPEWTGASRSASNRDIVDLPPDYSALGSKPGTPAPFIFNEPEPAAEAVPPETALYSDKIAEYFPEDDIYYEDDFESEPEEVAEAVDDYTDDYEVDYYDAPEEIADSYPSEYKIVPADDRPPSNIYGIDPSLIIPGITNAVQPDTQDKVNNQVNPVIPVNPVNEPNFSIPRIYELSRGSYYVQLAAYDTAESLEKSVSKIDHHYKPVVYKDGDRWYRVLLGPLNQGESAAVLARFKSIGYKDAFVRLAR